MKSLALVFIMLLSSWGSLTAAPVVSEPGDVYSVSNIRFSPDGIKIAYTLCGTSTEASGAQVKHCNLFISSRNGWKDGYPSSFISTDVEDFAWSPNSVRLAFLHNCGLRECLSVTDGMKTENLGEAVGGIFEWLTSDTVIISEAAAQLKDRSAASSSAGGLFVVHGDKERAHSLNATGASLVLITVPTDKRKVIDGNVPVFRGRPFVARAPGGKAIAYTVARRMSDGDSLVTVDVKIWQRGSKPRVVARNVTQSILNGELVWSPDGAKVAWCGGADEHTNHPNKVFIFDPKSGTLVTPEIPSSIKPCPVWRLYTEDLPDLAWVNGDYILVSADDYARSTATDGRANTVYQLNLRNGHIKRLYRGDRDEEAYILAATGDSSSGTGSLFLLVRPSDGGDASLMKWSRGVGIKSLVADIPGGISTLLFSLAKGRRKFGHLDQVGDSTPSLIINDLSNNKSYRVSLAPGVQWSQSIIWLYYSVDGQKRTAALVIPPKISKNSRLITSVYPTLSSSDLLGLADVEPFPGLSYWLTRGDVVLYPDMHIRSEHARTDIVADYKYAMRAFTEVKQRMGIKICGNYVFGHSAGALAVYDLVTSDVTLDGAVASDGFSNWEAFFGEGSSESSNMMPYGPAIAKYSSIGPTGTPWTNLGGYRAASPYYDFDKVTVPLLIGHGTKDPLDSYHAEAAFISLESLGKDVTLALADGGGHSPSGWSADQQKTFLQVVNRFIADHAPKHCKDSAR